MHGQQTIKLAAGCSNTYVAMYFIMAIRSSGKQICYFYSELEKQIMENL